MPAQRLIDFDTWRPGYGGATVRIELAGTNTLAPVYTDEALSVAAPNPQTLENVVIGNIAYGKFSDPLYVGVAVELNVNADETGGVIRPPIASLVGEDVSLAIVYRDGEGGEGGTVARTLAEVLQRTVTATDFGDLDNVDTAGNTVTLVAAIGAASGQGGGTVLIPAGTFPFTSLSVPTGVVLEGQGRDATTLVSITGAGVVTLTGDRAGLRRLALDGTSRIPSSVGVRIAGHDQTVLEDVYIQRFVTGLYQTGGSQALWKNVSIDSCTHGAQMYGSGADGPLEFNRWTGGSITNCITQALDLSYEGAIVQQNAFDQIGIVNSVAGGVRINGARGTSFSRSWWDGNDVAMAVLDDDDTTPAGRLINTVAGLNLSDCNISDGDLTFTGQCRDIVFDRTPMDNLAITLTTVVNNITARDCPLNAELVSITGGDAQRFTFIDSNTTGYNFLTTTASGGSLLWSMTLKPGQVGFFDALVVGADQASADSGEYWKAVSAKRPGSELAFDARTDAFVEGTIVQGATSGATGRVLAATAAVTGTLTLGEIVGVFIDNEIIAGQLGDGSASVNGTIVDQDVVLTGAVTTMRTDREDDATWNVTWDASGPNVQLNVAAPSSTVRWRPEIRCVVVPWR